MHMAIFGFCLGKKGKVFSLFIGTVLLTTQSFASNSPATIGTPTGPTTPTGPANPSPSKPRVPKKPYSLVAPPSLNFPDVISAENHVPVAMNAQFLSQIHRTATLTLSGQDPEGDPLSFVITEFPSNGNLGTVTREDNGISARVPYSPTPGFLGIDQFSFKVWDGIQFSNTATVNIQVTKALLPWMECNDPYAPANIYTSSFCAFQIPSPNMSIYDVTLAGLQSWVEVTDQAVVTTLVTNCADLYPALMAQKPAGINIIGGIKTASALPIAAQEVEGQVGAYSWDWENFDYSAYNFSDPAGWQAIANAAVCIRQTTGNNIVVLENEAALTPFYDGRLFTDANGDQIQVMMDYIQLRNSLQPLAATGIEFHFWLPQYYPEYGEGNDIHADTTMFIQSILDVLPNAKFLTSYTARYYWRMDREGVWRDGMMNLVGNQFRETLWLATDTTEGFGGCAPGMGMRQYTTTEALVLLGILPDTLPWHPSWGPVYSDTVLIFPNGNWIQTAQEFNNLLPTFAR